MRVVVIDEELPYPTTSGKRIRTLNLLLRLAERHRITYLSHRNTDPGEAREAGRYLADHGIESVVVDRPTPVKSVLRKGPGFFARLAWNLTSPLPYVVDINNSPALRRAIGDYAAGHEVDLWQCEWTPYTKVMDGLARQRRIVIAHNVESLIWQRYYETEENSLKRWYIKQQWRKMERFERGAFAEMDRVVAVSDADARLIRHRFGTPQVDVVDNGVDTDYFAPANAERDPHHVLFLGSLDWRPNLDAVRLLVQRIFPQVLAQEPSARLSIVGRNPPDWLFREANGRTGVELHANVPDVRPFLHRCGMLAVPLRIGGGSRLKILEALACQTPVVSTRVGAEGLALTADEHFIQVAEPEDMAEALVECIRVPARALEMARRGREVVLASYDWSILADRLERVWLACAAKQARAAAST